MTLPLRLTKYQIAEAQFKGEVMRDDGARDGDTTMAGFYGFTDATLEVFNAKLAASKGTLHLTLQEAAALYGELGNAADIAEDNLNSAGWGSETATFAGAARSFRGAQDKILAVFPEARRIADIGWARFTNAKEI